MINVSLTVMGRGYNASATLPPELELMTDARIDDALQAVSTLLGEREPLSRSCLVVLNGNHLGSVGRHDNVLLTDRDELVLIAPVAGG